MKAHRAGLLVLAISCVANPTGIRAQALKPETAHDFECYIQSAEKRMDERKSFLLADSKTALNQQVVEGRRIQTLPGNGVNPHKLTGGHVYDWIGTVFIEGATVDRTLRMLQDYDHRSQYFPEVIASSKLLCRTGNNQFRFTMRMKEPSVVDVESEVLWQEVDPHRWRCRSYSIEIKNVGKDQKYIQRLFTYWRLAETEKGVYVEGESITLSGEFGALMRTLGSMMGINPEKSLKKTLADMRENMHKPGLEFALPSTGLPACGEPIRVAGCVSVSTR
jgi:hypothetical protein